MTQLIMPRMYDAVARHQHEFVAWRWAYFLPGAMHITLAVLCIFFAQVRLLVLELPTRGFVKFWVQRIKLELFNDGQACIASVFVNHVGSDAALRL